MVQAVLQPRGAEITQHSCGMFLYARRAAWVDPPYEQGRPLSFDLEVRAASSMGRGCLSWVQSHNLAFYKAMMAIDHHYLSKVRKNALVSTV
eukprot:570851-Pelagomonas_calceolata.AAC.1